MAYGLQRYQLSAPDWLGDDRFDIVAKVPEGATKEQFATMLRDLLTSRFKLATHHEEKEIQAYELVVSKNGPKLEESVDDSQSAPGTHEATSRATLGPDGFPVLPAGRSSAMVMMKGRARMRMAKTSMEQLAARLSSQVSCPVTDATGLKGKYDFTLSWVSQILQAQDGDADSPGPDIFGALQQQIGLKLESKKAPVDVLVVDRIEKLPTEN